MGVEQEVDNNERQLKYNLLFNVSLPLILK